MLAGATLALAFVAATMAASSPAQAAVPDAPTNVMVTAGKKTIAVTWTASNLAVHHYIATTNPGSKTCTSLSGTNGCTVTGLTANTAYTVSVVACPTSSNVTECSSPSTPSGSATPGPPTAPGKPTVAYTGVGGEVRVTWVVPNPSSPIATFQVTPTPAVANATGTCTQALASNATSCVYGNLVAGTAYTFKVVAVGTGVVGTASDTGSSVASTASNSIVAGPPGKPGKPEVIRTGDGDDLLVSWAAPTTGAPPTGYTVTSNHSVTLSDGCGENPNFRSCTVTVDDPSLSHTFTVVAHGGGDSGNSDPSDPVVPGTPGMPGTPTVELTGSGAVTVSWTEPADGSAVDHYTLTPTPGSPATVSGTCDDGPMVLSCDVTGLNPSTSYTFKVTAVSGSGVSAQSAASDPVVPSAPGTPAAPTVAVTGSGTATVSWSAPANGGPVNGYTVISDPSATTPAGCGDDVTVRTCTFTGLDPATAYTFQVEAVGPAGNTDSPASGAVVPGAPGTPGTPSVNLTAIGTAVVSWAAPTSGGPVTSYTLTSNQPITVPNGCTALNTRSCTLTGLDPTLSYTFQVNAVGPAGNMLSAVSSPSVKPDKPGAPGTPSVTLTSPGHATVAWTAPTSGGPVTSYTLTSNQSVNLPANCTDLNVRSCVFTDLDPTLSYTFTATAVGPLGPTPSAASSPAVTPAAPGTPGTPSVTLTSPGNATVAWTAPTSGGPVTSYTLTSNQSVSIPANCTDLNVRSCVFTNLDPTLSYTFQVNAVGPAGNTLSAVSSPSVKPDKPGASGTPVVVVNSPGNATVTWTASNTGGPLTSYTLTSNQTVTVPPGCTDLTVRSCTFTNLDPTLSYTFQVISVGPAGPTSSATSSPAVKPDKPGAPGTPTVQNGAPGSVTVTWTAPTTGGVVSTYSVTSLPEVTPPVGCTAITQLTCVFSGLDPNQTYGFQVTANSPAGGTASARSDQVTPGAPSPPGTPTATVVAASTVRVTWTASPPGGGVVSGYSVTSDPAVAPPAACTLITALTCDFTGLDASKSYTFAVTAVGGAGRTSSVARSASVMPGAPGVPGTPTAQVTGAGTAKINWTRPVGGGPVTGYSVTSDPVVSPPAACTQIAVTACEFTGLDATASYTFLVTANGPAGNTPSAARSTAVRPAVPGAPGTPTVSLAGPNAVTVRWTAPINGGPLTGYSVLSDPAISAPPGCTHVLVLECTFDRLVSGVSYTFKVAAEGPVGNPTASAASAPVIPGPPPVPGKPMVALTTVANQVRVSWATLPDGAPIAGFLVQSAPGGLGCDVAAAPADTSCLVSSLDPATAYTFRVQALGVPNSGDSAFSPRSDVITPGALTAPTDIDVAVGDRQLAVSWTAPGNAGDRVAYYRATANPGGVTCRTANAASTDCVITGLYNLTSYTVTVVAVGNTGVADSPASVSSPRVRPTAGPPGAPTGVVATGRDSGVQVTWKAPASLGDGISRYVATVSGDPDGLTCVTAELSCTISGLVNGRTYKITVVAVGRAASGTSGPSTPPTVLTLDTAPTAPTGVTVTAGTSDLTVRFTAGAGGGPVANYTATAAGGTSAGPCTTTAASPTSCVITGVTPGTSYTVTVVANGVTTGLRSPASAPSSPVVALAAPAPPLPATLPTGTTALTSSAGATLKVGQVTTLSGTGFQPFSGVTLGSYPGPFTSTTAIADANGTFSAQVTITGATGSRTLIAAGTKVGAARYLSLAVTITAATSNLASAHTTSVDAAPVSTGPTTAGDDLTMADIRRHLIGKPAR